MQELIPGILYAFAALFIILDPLLSVPIFAAMTKGQTAAEIHRQAFIAVSVAGGLMYIFLVFNTAIFSILGLNFAAFQIAGGINPVPSRTPGSPGNRTRAFQGAYGLGGRGSHRDTAPVRAGHHHDGNAVVKRCTGSSSRLSRSPSRSLPPGSSSIMLKGSSVVLGDVVTDIMGKVLGMLVAAIAVKIIASGILAYIATI